MAKKIDPSAHPFDRTKATLTAESLTDGWGRTVPLKGLPVKVTVHYGNGATQDVMVSPKVFASGTVGVNATGQIPLPGAPDGRGMQVSLNLVYVKPKGAASPGATS